MKKFNYTLSLRPVWATREPLSETEEQLINQSPKQQQQNTPGGGGEKQKQL